MFLYKFVKDKKIEIKNQFYHYHTLEEIENMKHETETRLFLRKFSEKV